MPPVGHAKGEIPEAFQPRSDARNYRFAALCCAMAVLVFGSWIGFVHLRKVLRKRAQPMLSPGPQSPATANPGPPPGPRRP